MQEFNLESFLDAGGVDKEVSNRFDSGTAEESSGIPWSEPGYTGKIDYRVRQLSYSSFNTLHECPRKFELYKKRASREEDSLKSRITFNFGHLIGDAIQLHFQGHTKQQIVWHLFNRWNCGLFDFDEKGQKSFWLAIIALERFLSLRKDGFLSEYELVYFQGKPACELSFKIILPDSFNYRGHVDVVLRHRITGEIIVLECKTTGMDSVNPASYKNSSQAIGYSVVLDHITPELSSYKVLYLVYTSKDREFHVFPFEKLYSQRAGWIQDLILDTEFIKLCEDMGRYPLHGESCVGKWNRECEYLQACTLTTDVLTKLPTAESEDKVDYQFTITLADLISTQIRKVTV